MTGISDYAFRVSYYRARYSERKPAYNAAARDYRKRNAEAIKIARGLGISIPEARRMIERERRQ